ncbi:MAG: HAD-IA family hydrolase [Litorimonas sp.]
MPNIPLHIRLVIFDCDGVLVDSEPLANAVMAEALTAQGWPMTGPEAIARFKGGHMHQVHSALEAELGRSVSRNWIGDFDIACRIALAGVTAVDGIANLISRVRQAGLPICVASQGPHEKMAVTLKAAGLNEIFAGRIFSSVDVKNPKPAPDLFLHAAQSCEVPPQNCLVIEDSRTGVAAAQAAEMQVIYLNPEGDVLEGAETARHPDEISL